MKKHLICLIMLICTLLNVNVYATECELLDGDFETIELEDGSLNIVKYNGACSDIELPKTINNKKISSINEDAFNNENINSIKIIDNINIYDSVNTFSENIILKGLKDSNIINYAKKYERKYNEIYTIDFDIENIDTIFVEDNKYTINIENPIMEYYSFAGWTDGFNNYQKDSTIDIIDNVLLMPVWIDNSYVVKFNANGGSGKMSNITLTTNHEYLLPSVAYTKKNYKFYGWNTEANGSGTTYKNNEAIYNLIKENNGEITLYAMWGNKSNITFDAKGGNKVYTTKTVYYNSKIGTLPTTKRKGYTFTGWYTSDGKLIDANTFYPYKNNIKLYAHWKKITYKINYSLTGDNNPANIISYNVTTSFKLLNPKRSGYKFVGWYKDSKYKKRITKITKGTTGNLTLYAKWTPIKYNISFDANGGSGKMSKIYNVKYNKEVTLTKNKYKRVGYKFIGWNTKKDGTGVAYTNAQSVKNLTGTSGKTVKLYAQWEIITYTITYNFGDDNTYSLSNPTTYTVNDTFELQNPEKEGYLFLGWCTNSSLDTKVKVIKRGTTGNKTYYAKWIAYDPNSGISKTRIFMVDLAQSQIGNYNGKKYWTWYGSKHRMAWCCVFVSWLADQNGILNIDIPKFASVPVGEKYFKSRNQYKKRDKYTPLPGDIVFFDWNHNGSLDHVGIVEKVSGEYVYTIEGNSTNRVARKKYKLTSNDINGYGIPNYDK